MSVVARRAARPKAHTDCAAMPSRYEVRASSLFDLRRGWGGWGVCAVPGLRIEVERGGTTGQG